MADLEVTVVTPRAAMPVIAQKTFELNEAEAFCKYTLVRKIARGGMGQIYFGVDPQLERQVAVKVSSISEGGEDPRFTKEAKVLALLAHPNIVPIHATGVDAQGRPFDSMKLVKGRSLQAVTLKAMATDRDKRYSSVEVFARYIEAYQNGLATSAEDAGVWRRVKLWVGRHKVLAGAAIVLVVVVSPFTARVLQKGR